jgi:hypothetical protein
LRPNTYGGYANTRADPGERDSSLFISVSEGIFAWFHLALARGTPLLEQKGRGLRTYWITQHLIPKGGSR